MIIFDDYVCLNFVVVVEKRSFLSNFFLKILINQTLFIFCTHFVLTIKRIQRGVVIEVEKKAKRKKNTTTTTVCLVNRFFFV